MFLPKCFISFCYFSENEIYLSIKYSNSLWFVYGKLLLFYFDFIINLLIHIFSPLFLIYFSVCSLMFPKYIGISTAKIVLFFSLSLCFLFFIVSGLTSEWHSVVPHRGLVYSSCLWYMTMTLIRPSKGCWDLTELHHLLLEYSSLKYGRLYPPSFAPKSFMFGKYFS